MLKKIRRKIQKFFDLNNIYRVQEKIENIRSQRKLKNNNFTIISDNCWGSKIYKDFNVRYNTPFVGLFMYSPCYIKLLKNLDYYLQSELYFIKESKYNINKELRKQKWYPIGLLGNEIEIHFLHYKSEAEAENKWMRRKKRMNMDNIFVELSDKELCTEEIVVEFDKLPFKHKVCFTAKNYPNIICAVQLKEYEDDGCIGDIYKDSYIVKRHFDIIDWLNGNLEN